MHLKIADLFELDLRFGLFVKLWPFGQLHVSRLGFYADPWQRT
jgi:hypothetical protein